MALPFRFTAESIAPVVHAALEQFDAAYLNTLPKTATVPGMTNTPPTMAVPPVLPFAPPPRMPDESDDDYAARSAASKEEYDAAVVAREEAAKNAAAEQAAGETVATENPTLFKSTPWADLEPDEQGALVGDVQHVMDHSSGAGAGLHDRWVAMKQALGWSGGPAYNPANKTHPYGVSYGDLPDEQKARYNLVHSLVLAMSQATTVQSGG